MAEGKTDEEENNKDQGDKSEEILGKEKNSEYWPGAQGYQCFQKCCKRFPVRKLKLVSNKINIFKSSSEGLLRSSSEGLVRSSSEDLLRSSSECLLRLSSEDLLRSSSEDLLRSSSEDLLNSEESNHGSKMNSGIIDFHILISISICLFRNCGF